MEVIWRHLGCPLSGGCPLFGGSAIGGSTVYIYTITHFKHPPALTPHVPVPPPHIYFKYINFLSLPSLYSLLPSPPPPSPLFHTLPPPPPVHPTTLLPSTSNFQILPHPLPPPSPPPTSRTTSAPPSLQITFNYY